MNYANKLTVDYKYTEPNAPIMTACLLRVYQAYASQQMYAI